ncbi:reverse transcriptase domain-containing protein [Tanacetum coccineum]
MGMSHPRTLILMGPYLGVCQIVIQSQGYREPCSITIVTWNEDRSGMNSRIEIAVRKVMAISVISISSDSSEESVGTPTARVILFGTIPTTIPSTVHIVNSPTIPLVAPTIQYTSPFICTDSSDSDTSERPYSSSETSSDSHSNTSSDSSLRHSSSSHSISDSPCDSPIFISAGPSRKRSRSPTTSVPVASPIPGALSPVHADLLPPYKRIKDSDFVTDFEVSSEEGFVPHVPRKIGLGVDLEGRMLELRMGLQPRRRLESSARGTIEIWVDRVTYLVISDDTVEPVREVYPDLVSADGFLEVMQRGLDVVMQELYDHMVEISVHRVIVIESVQRDQRNRIMATSQQSAAMSEMISMLERNNMRLRGILGVERQRVDRLWRGMLTMSNATRSRMTQDAINKLIAKRVTEALEAYDVARNPRTETKIEDEQQENNVKAIGNNGNRNGNGKPNVNNVETVFHISNCPPKYQVKYATCTLLNGALTWWNSHKRTVRVDDVYAMTWKALMKLMTEVYCHRNEIKRMETEFWNLTVKGNDLTAHNHRFQELTLLCTNMVPKEGDPVERYIRGLLDNIQVNVTAAEPTRL